MSGKSVTAIDIENGKRIRVRRLELKMSQGDLGDALGVTFQQIQKYEKGANRVGSGRMVDVAKALQTTVPALYGIGVEARPPAVLSLISRKDGQRLAAAFNQIHDPRQRASLVAIAEKIAEAVKQIDTGKRRRFAQAAE